MKAEFIFFYLEGRDARLLRNDIDLEKLATDVCNGQGTVYEVLHLAAEDAAKEIRSERHKKKFADSYDDEIAEVGNDVTTAYEHFVNGRIDELVFRLEPDLTEALGEVDDDDEDEDDVEDEDDDTEDDKE